MWLKRDDWVSLVTNNARLEGEVESKERLIERLDREVEFWRQRAQLEQNRADRLADRDFEIHGLAPVSDLGQREQGKKIESAEAQRKRQEDDLAEIYADSVENLTGEPEPEIPLDGVSIAEDLQQVLMGR